MAPWPPGLAEAKVTAKMQKSKLEPEKTWRACPEHKDPTNPHKGHPLQIISNKKSWLYIYIVIIRAYKGYSKLPTIKSICINHLYHSITIYNYWILLKGGSTVPRSIRTGKLGWNFGGDHQPSVDPPMPSLHLEFDNGVLNQRCWERIAMDNRQSI